MDEMDLSNETLFEEDFSSYGLGHTSKKLFAKKFGVVGSYGSFITVSVINVKKKLVDFHVKRNSPDEVKASIRKLKSIECFRGVRMLTNLPCHGQRTQTNAGTTKQRRGGRMVKFVRSKLSSQRVKR